MAKRTWTEHKLTDNMLKQLAQGYAAHLRGDKSTFCGGAGHGSSSGRFGLRNRSLIDNDDNITESGIKAMEDARKEGW